METFLGWGNSVNKAYERWRETQTRTIVAISTQNVILPTGTTKMGKWTTPGSFGRTNVGSRALSVAVLGMEQPTS